MLDKNIDNKHRTMTAGSMNKLLYTACSNIYEMSTSFSTSARVLKGKDAAAENRCSLVQGTLNLCKNVVQKHFDWLAISSS